MKDDLHELIDGGLPDEQEAELLHLLSVDPEKRSIFRQQMRLQKNLCRNGGHARLSALEEGEMLDRIARVVGEPTGVSGRVARRGVLMLAVGFLIGSGAGFLGYSLVDDRNLSERPDTVRVVQQVPATLPEVHNLDRDSVVAAIRDSLVAAQKETAAKPKVTPKKKSKRPKGHPDTGG